MAQTTAANSAELIAAVTAQIEAARGSTIDRRAVAFAWLEKEHPDLSADDAANIIEAAAGKTARQIVGIRADTIKPENTVWLWDQWIPLRAITILLGEEGLGKSHVTIEKAAEATHGELPGEFKGEPVTVLFATIEDDPGSIIVPRLMAARGGKGADRSRIEFIQVSEGGTDDVGLVLPRDADALGAYAEQVGARLIVIDPLTTFFEGKIDTHKESDVKQALAPLQKIAERHNLAILGVHHPNKSGATNEREASGASTAFRTAPRSSMVFGLDPDDPTGEDGDNRILAHGKHNHTRAQKAWRVRIEDATVKGDDGEPIGVSRAVFGERCGHKVKDVLGARAAYDAAPKGADALRFLSTYLGEGAKVKQDVEGAAKAAGITEITLKRAAATIGVVKEPTGEKPPRSMWRLPAEDEATPGRLTV
jgi:hypothetical protein